MQKQTRSQVDNEKSCCKALISCNIYNKAPGVQSATRCQPPLQTHGGERDTVLGIHKICWIKCSAGQGGLVPAEEAGKRGAKPHATPPPKERAILGRGGGRGVEKAPAPHCLRAKWVSARSFGGPSGPPCQGQAVWGAFGVQRQTGSRGGNHSLSLRGIWQGSGPNGLPLCRPSTPLGTRELDCP